MFNNTKIELVLKAICFKSPIKTTHVKTFNVSVVFYFIKHKRTSSVNPVSF